jgi:hypothetical protein
MLMFVSALMFSPISWHDIATRNALFTSIAHEIKHAEITCAEPYYNYSRCSAKTTDQVVFMSCSTTTYGFCYLPWSKNLME